MAILLANKKSKPLNSGRNSQVAQWNTLQSQVSTWKPNKDLEADIGPVMTALIPVGRKSISRKMTRPSNKICPHCRQKQPTSSEECRTCQDALVKTVKSTYEPATFAQETTVIGTSKVARKSLGTFSVKQPRSFEPPLQQDQTVIMAK